LAPTTTPLFFKLASLAYIGRLYLLHMEQIKQRCKEGAVITEWEVGAKRKTTEK
jgi:hypothetical protein